MCSFIRSHYHYLLSRSRGLKRRGADPCLGVEATSAAAAAPLTGIECRRFAAFGIAARFMRDQSGAYAIIFGLVAPVFVGALALGTETGLWYSTQASMQGAADSSAVSAAVGLTGGDTKLMAQAQAKATAAGYGFVDGSSGTVVTVNQPPLSGPNVATPGAVEVIIKQPQTLLFASEWLNSPVVVQARAVAGPNGPCVIALNQIPLVPGILAAAGAAVLADQCNVADNANTLTALSLALFANITAQQVNVVGGIVNVLGTITTTQGTHSPAAPTADPFAAVPFPPKPGGGCNPYSFNTYGTITGTHTLSPGDYCGGINVTGGTVTLNPGIYYMDGLLASFAVTGGSVTGTGVMIALPSGALLNLGGLGGTINLTAPSSGTYAGLVFFADRLFPLLPAISFSGAPQFNWVGTIYAPTATVAYLPGSGTRTGQCTRLIANEIAFSGSASFSKCALRLGPSSGAPASLVE